MNYSDNELTKIKEEILRKACQFAKIHRFENLPPEKINFENRKDLEQVLREYRKIDDLTNPFHKQLLNQMITNGNNIPSIKIMPYFPIDLSNNEPLGEFFDDLKSKIKDHIEEKEETKENTIEESQILSHERNTIEKSQKSFIQVSLFDYSKYYCKKCDHEHRFDSDIGNSHYEDNKIEIHLDITKKRLIEAKESFKRIKEIMRGY